MVMKELFKIYSEVKSKIITRAIARVNALYGISVDEKQFSHMDIDNESETIEVVFSLYDSNESCILDSEQLSMTDSEFDKCISEIRDARIESAKKKQAAAEKFREQQERQKYEELKRKFEANH